MIEPIQDNLSLDNNKYGIDVLHLPNNGFVLAKDLAFPAEQSRSNKPEASEFQV